MEIVLATKNRHKLREFKQILDQSDITILSLENFPGCPETVEDGSSFEENALKKAAAVAAFTGRATIADDSGLEVDHLQGKPGIYSARYSGKGADDEKNNVKLLGELEGLPMDRRGAQFRCVIALVSPEGNHRTVEGTCRGRIAAKPQGSHGFGYDPLFCDEQSGLTFAEMGPEQKNLISHRSRAIRELKKILPPFLREFTSI